MSGDFKGFYYKPARRAAIEEMFLATTRAFPDADRAMISEYAKQNEKSFFSTHMAMASVLYQISRDMAEIAVGPAASLSEKFSAAFAIENEWSKGFEFGHGYWDTEDFNFITVGPETMEPKKS